MIGKEVEGKEQRFNNRGSAEVDLFSGKGGG